MPVSLTTPKVISKTIDSLRITDFINSVERGTLEIHYMTHLDDGTPHQRGRVQIEGRDAVKAFYARLNEKLAGQDVPDFESASRELLYAKIMEETGFDGALI